MTRRSINDLGATLPVVVTDLGNRVRRIEETFPNYIQQVNQAAIDGATDTATAILSPTIEAGREAGAAAGATAGQTAGASAGQTAGASAGATAGATAGASAGAQAGAAAAQPSIDAANAAAGLADAATGNANTATTNANAATAQLNAAIAQANNLGTLAATQVQSNGPTLAIKIGTGTWPSEADAYFPGVQSLYTRFDGLTRVKTTFTGVIDVSRPSTATFNDSAGVIQTAASGVARLGWRFASGTATWVLAGLLIEMQATNLLLQSTDFTVTPWSRVGLVAMSTALIEDSSTGAHYGVQNITGFAAGQTVTISCEASERAGSAKRYLSIICPAGGALGSNTFGVFDLATGGVTTSGGVAGATARAERLSGNRWLCILTFTTTSAGSVSTQARLSNISTSASPSYAGDGASGLNVSEVQIETGSLASSRIRTTTAQVTRAGDVLTKALGPEHNPNAGTMLARVFRMFAPPAGSAARIVQLDDGTENNRLTVRASSGKIVFEAVSGGAVTGTATGPDWLANTSYAVMATYDRTTGAMVLTVNGTDYTATASALPSGLTTRRFGCDSTGASQLNGFLLPTLENTTNGLKTGFYYARALPPAERSEFA